jgi:transposase
MLEAFKSLPEDPDELRAISVQMAQHIQSQAYQIEKLKAELHGHRKA